MLPNLKLVIIKEHLKKISLTNIYPLCVIITESTLSLGPAFCTHSCNLYNYSVRKVIWQLYGERHFARLIFNILNYHFRTQDNFLRLHNPQVTF